MIRCTDGSVSALGESDSMLGSESKSEVFCEDDFDITRRGDNFLYKFDQGLVGGLVVAVCCFQFSVEIVCWEAHAPGVTTKGPGFAG